MTEERKAEVNRRLAEFEGWEQVGATIFARPLPDDDEEYARFPPDYTTDLNALARLEAKLPMHVCKISWVTAEYVVERVPMLGVRYDFGGPLIYDTVGTEAEARAEAIAQYLEAQT